MNTSFEDVISGLLITRDCFARPADGFSGRGGRSYRPAVTRRLIETAKPFELWEFIALQALRASGDFTSFAGVPDHGFGDLMSSQCSFDLLINFYSLLAAE